MLFGVSSLKDCGARTHMLLSHRHYTQLHNRGVACAHEGGGQELGCMRTQ